MKDTKFPTQPMPEDRPSEGKQKDRILPREVSTGIGRGQQGVGGTGLKIDNDNQRIFIIDDDGNEVGLGIIPGTSDIGFYTRDSNGNINKKTVAGIDYYYDTDNNAVMTVEQGKFKMFDADDSDRERLRIGRQPDNSFNVVITKTGFSVDDVFS